MFDNVIEKIKNKNIYSIEGNIGAGKTTLINLINKYNNNIIVIEEPIKEWKNLGGNNLLNEFYTNPKRWGFFLSSIQ